MMLEIVWDKADCTLTLGDINIVAAPRSNPPFRYQAIVEEQDTHLILGEQHRLTDPGKPAWYLANTLEAVRPYDLGTVVVKGHSPHRLLAVVHDVEQTPTLSPDSVTQAYLTVLQIGQSMLLTSLAMPLLGTVHGHLSEHESLQRLRDCLLQGPIAGLQRLWLILPTDSDCHCLSYLSS